MADRSTRALDREELVRRRVEEAQQRVAEAKARAAAMREKAQQQVQARLQAAAASSPTPTAAAAASVAAAPSTTPASPAAPPAAKASAADRAAARQARVEEARQKREARLAAVQAKREERAAQRGGAAASSASAAAAPGVLRRPAVGTGHSSGESSTDPEPGLPPHTFFTAADMSCAELEDETCSTADSGGISQPPPSTSTTAAADTYLARVAAADSEVPVHPSLTGFDKVQAVPRKVGQTITIRLFVSSTFVDTQGERDMLIKKVIPALNKRLAARDVTVVPVDLRWGVSAEESRPDTIQRTCLNEIDRCRNSPDEMPWFLGLRSARYGWVQQTFNKPEEFDEPARYDWMEKVKGAHPEGISITSMEVWHAVLGATAVPENAQPHAFFAFRDPSFFANVEPDWQWVFDFEYRPEDAELPDNVVHQYSKTPLCAQYRCDFDTITEQIRSATDRCVSFDYSVDHEVETRETGRLPSGKRFGTGTVLGLEGFAAEVFSLLYTAIDREYPAYHEQPSEHVRFNIHHELMARARRDGFVAREAELEQLSSYVTDALPTGHKVRPLVVAGAAGSGKSSLLGELCGRLDGREEDGIYVIKHFVGANPASHLLQPTLQRLCTELSACLVGGVGVYNPPTTLSALRSELPTLFTKAMRKRGEPDRIVLVLDGVESMAEDALDMSWLPPYLPSLVRVVVGVSVGSPAAAALLARTPAPHCLDLALLSCADAETLVRTHLWKFHKKLCEDASNALLGNQMELLMSKEDASLPLYLLGTCAELVKFGVYEKVTTYLKEIPGRLPALFDFVLQRLELEHGPEYVSTVMRILGVSLDGINETDLVLLLREHTFKDELISDFAQLYSHIQLYITSGGAGHLQFFHKPIAEVVRGRYLQTPADQQAALDILIGYYRRHADPDGDGSWRGDHARAFECLPALMAVTDDATTTAAAEATARRLLDLLLNARFVVRKVMLCGLRLVQDDVRLALSALATIKGPARPDAAEGSPSASTTADPGVEAVEALKWIQKAMMLAASSADVDLATFPFRMAAHLFTTAQHNSRVREFVRTCRRLSVGLYPRTTGTLLQVGTSALRNTAGRTVASTRSRRAEAEARLTALQAEEDAGGGSRLRLVSSMEIKTSSQALQSPQTLVPLPQLHERVAASHFGFVVVDTDDGSAVLECDLGRDLQRERQQVVSIAADAEVVLVGTGPIGSVHLRHDWSTIRPPQLLAMDKRNGTELSRIAFPAEARWLDNLLLLPEAPGASERALDGRPFAATLGDGQLVLGRIVAGTSEVAIDHKLAMPHARTLEEAGAWQGSNEANLAVTDEDLAAIRSSLCLFDGAVGGGDSAPTLLVSCTLQAHVPSNVGGTLAVWDAGTARLVASAPNALQLPHNARPVQTRQSLVAVHGGAGLILVTSNLFDAEAILWRFVADEAGGSESSSSNALGGSLELVKSFKIDKPPGLLGGVALLSDARHAAFAVSGHVVVMNMFTGTLVALVQAHKSSINTLCAITSRPGNFFYTTSPDKFLSTWRLAAKKKASVVLKGEGEEKRVEKEGEQGEEEQEEQEEPAWLQDWDGEGEVGPAGMDGAGVDLEGLAPLARAALLKASTVPAAELEQHGVEVVDLAVALPDAGQDTPSRFFTLGKVTGSNANSCLRLVEWSTSRAERLRSFPALATKAGSRIPRLFTKLVHIGTHDVGEGEGEGEGQGPADVLVCLSATDVVVVSLASPTEPLAVLGDTKAKAVEAMGSLPGLPNLFALGTKDGRLEVWQAGCGEGETRLVWSDDRVEGEVEVLGVGARRPGNKKDGVGLLFATRSNRRLSVWQDSSGGAGAALQMTLVADFTPTGMHSFKSLVVHPHLDVVLGINNRSSTGSGVSLMHFPPGGTGKIEAEAEADKEAASSQPQDEEQQDSVAAAGAIGQDGSGPAMWTILSPGRVTAASTSQDVQLSGCGRFALTGGHRQALVLWRVPELTPVVRLKPGSTIGGHGFAGRDLVLGSSEEGGVVDRLRLLPDAGAQPLPPWWTSSYTLQAVHAAVLGKGKGEADGETGGPAVAPTPATIVDRDTPGSRELAFRTAAGNGDIATMQRLHEQGVDVNCQDAEYGYTALVSCIEKPEVVKWLIDHGASPKTLPGMVISIIELAAMKAPVEVVEMLLDAGAEINGTNMGSRMSPLVMAIQYSRVETVKLLLRRGADPNLAVSGSPIKAMYFVDKVAHANIAQGKITEEAFQEMRTAMLDAGAEPV